MDVPFLSRLRWEESMVMVPSVSSCNVVLWSEILYAPKVSTDVAEGEEESTFAPNARIISKSRVHAMLWIVICTL